MSALPADIVRATRASRTVTRTDAAIEAAFAKARDQGDAPQAGYFQSATDAALALDAQAALIATFRRRFAVRVAGEIAVDPLAAIPTFHLIDSEQDIDDAVLLTRFELDLETETTSIEVIG